MGTQEYRNALMVMPLLPPYFGGAGVQAGYLANALAREGVTVEFATNNYDLYSCIDAYQGIKTHRYRTFGMDYLKLAELLFYLKVFFHVLTNKKYKIIHFHSMTGFDIILFPVYKLLKKSIIVKLTLLGNDDPEVIKQRKLLGGLYSWGLSFVDRFVAISDGLHDACIRAGVSEDKVERIPNGVDLQKFKVVLPDEKRVLKARLGYGGYDKVFLSIGQIEHRKGYDLLIKAWGKISREFPSSVLCIAGPGNDQSNGFYCSLQAEIEKMGLSSSIKFLGKMDNIADLLGASDAFLFCSRKEGFPNVWIEAMVSAVPLVVMSIPGITEELARYPHIAKVCDARDPDVFAADTTAFIQAFDMPKALADIAAVKERNGIHAVAHRYVALYKKLRCRDDKRMLPFKEGMS